MGSEMCIRDRPYTSLGVLITCSGLALAALGQPMRTSEDAKHAGGDGDAVDYPDVCILDTPVEHMLPRHDFVLGILLANFNVLFDVAGAAITRYHGVGLSTWTINAIRFGSAALITAAGMVSAHVVSSLRSSPPPAWAVLPVLTTRGWATIFLGASLVTFTCPALLNFSLFHIPLGAWTALSSIGPVFAVPVLWFLRREVTPRAGLLGVFLAAAGATTVSLSLHRDV